MRFGKRLLVTGFVLLGAAVPLRAESVTAAGRPGWSRWSVTTRGFGSALSQAAQEAEGTRDRSSFNDQIGYGITPRVWAAGSFDYNLLELTDPDIPGLRTAELAQLFLASSGLFYPWPQARIRPFLGAGLGVGRSDIRNVPSWLRQAEKSEQSAILQKQPPGTTVDIRLVSSGQINDYLVRTWTVGTEIGLSRRLALNLAFRQVVFSLTGTLVKDWRGTIRRADGSSMVISPEVDPGNRTTRRISEDVVQSQIGLGLTYRF